jgi:uncharacterized membrane protein
VRQSKGIESTYYYIAKAIDDPRWRAKLLVPVAIFLMIIGLGLIIPGGGALIGAMPLFIGIWLFAKGLGWEQQLERLMIDMRESATGGIWSSLLWGLSIVSVLLSILTAYQVFSATNIEIDGYVAWLGSEFNVNAVNRDIAVWAIAINEALTWIVVSAFSFALSLGVLRWKEGSFTGRSVLLLGLGGVVYAFAKAALVVVLIEMGGSDFSLDYQSVSDTWGMPVFAIIGYYLLRTAVQSVTEDEGVTGENRFWGV